MHSLAGSVKLCNVRVGVSEQSLGLIIWIRVRVRVSKTGKYTHPSKKTLLLSTQSSGELVGDVKKRKEANLHSYMPPFISEEHD